MKDTHTITMAVEHSGGDHLWRIDIHTRCTSIVVDHYAGSSRRGGAGRGVEAGETFFTICDRKPGVRIYP